MPQENTTEPQVISRAQYVRWITDQWPNKSAVRTTLVESALALTRGWPAPAFWIFCAYFVELGQELERAQTPEECAEAFIAMLKKLKCPEPGWESANVRFAA